MNYRPSLPEQLWWRGDGRSHRFKRQPGSAVELGVRLGTTQPPGFKNKRSWVDPVTKKRMTRWVTWDEWLTIVSADISCCGRLRRQGIDENGPIPGVERVAYCGHAMLCEFCAARRARETRDRLRPKLLELERQSEEEGLGSSWAHLVLTWEAAVHEEDLRPCALLGWAALKRMIRKINRRPITKTAKNGNTYTAYESAGMAWMASMESGHKQTARNCHIHLLLKTAGTAYELASGDELCARCDGAGGDCRRCNHTGLEPASIALAQSLLPIWRESLERALDDRYEKNDWTIGSELSDEWNDAVVAVAAHGGIRGGRSTSDPKIEGRGSDTRVIRNEDGNIEKVDVDDLVSEVLKYASKNLVKDDMAKQVVETWVAWQSIRRVRCGGRLHGFKLPESDDPVILNEADLEEGETEPKRLPIKWSKWRWVGNSSVDWREMLRKGSRILKRADIIADEIAWKQRAPPKTPD